MGSLAGKSLDHRFFIASCLVASLAAFSATLINLFLNLKMALTVITSGMTVIYSLFYVWAQRANYKFFVLPYIFISLATLGYVWFLNAGSNGPVAWVFSVAMIIYVLITRGWMRVVSVSATLITIITVYFLAYYHPGWVVPYSNPTEKFADNLLTALLCLALLVFILSYLVHIYREEEATVKLQNQEIRAQERDLRLYQNHLEALVRERTAELEMARNKAEESDRLKSAFLSNMSHEIRTPMNAIIGFTDLLRDENLSEEEREQYIDIITDKGNQLLKIIDDILNLSKVDAGEVKISFAPCDIKKEVLDDLYYSFKNILKSYGKGQLDLRLNHPASEKELVIYTDADRLKQVLSNLIDNAIKFTNEGYVEFGCSYSGEDNQKIKFYVKDTGIGIPKEKQKIIFKRFRQVEESYTRHFRGTGLGLSISQKLVEMLGGEIYLESEPGRGTTFWFELPAHTADEPKEEIKRDSGEVTVDWKGKKVLIVEDSLSNFQLLESYLAGTGIEIVHATTGNEAVEKFENNGSFDLVLMDIQLPEMDGLEATRIIREKDTETPVIAQTAYAFEEESRKMRQAGCNEILVKPILKKDLILTVDKYIS
ncbi:MAG: hypothetical protein Kow00127_20960 [Bacteroidales bacterium]